MKVHVHGEEIDYHDDEALRSASSSHAIKLVALVKSKQLRRQLAAFYSDVYFLYIKAAGVMAFHELRGHDTVPTEILGELVTFLRSVVGEGKPPQAVESQPPQEPTKEIIVP